MKKIILIFSVFLISCSLMNNRPNSTVDKIEIEKNIEPIKILHPPLPEPVTWEHFIWTVLTPDIMRDLLKKYDEGKISENDIVFYAVTPNGYEHLSINVSEMIRYIKEQKGNIMYYRETVPKQIFIPKEQENR